MAPASVRRRKCSAHCKAGSPLKLLSASWPDRSRWNPSSLARPTARGAGAWARAPRVRGSIPVTGWRVVEDVSVAPGGTRVNSHELRHGGASERLSRPRETRSRLTGARPAPPGEAGPARAARSIAGCDRMGRMSGCRSELARYTLSPVRTVPASRPSGAGSCAAPQPLDNGRCA